MCGILFTNDPNIKKKSFVSALYEMEHRGPDSTGGYVSYENNKLGHNRLKIIDLNNRSNQPLKSQNSEYDIIFNGEIYNYAELAKKYNLDMITKSDTEVLLELYVLLGSKMLQELNGMFSFVIYNNQTSEIFAARDRLGIKPLYYTKQRNYITLSSEISPIIKLYNFSEIDDIGIRQYKKLRAFFNGRTYLKNVQMFPAGYFMEKSKVQRYWCLPIGQKDQPEDDELVDLLNSSVKYRCISDVEVGSYLSGGIDSTLITSIAKKVHSWTVGFNSLNEFEWGKLGAAFIGTSHHEVLVNEDSFISSAIAMIKKRKEPLSVPNEVLLYEMTKQVKIKNTVVLSGEGADGYVRIFNWAQNNKWDLESFDSYY